MGRSPAFYLQALTAASAEERCFKGILGQSSCTNLAEQQGTQKSLVNIRAFEQQAAEGEKHPGIKASGCCEPRHKYHSAPQERADSERGSQSEPNVSKLHSV